MIQYTDPVSFTETNLYGCGEGDDVYTVAEFLALVDTNAFMDYDGYGYPVKDNKAARVTISPSSARSDIPEDATHIVWYNR